MVGQSKEVKSEMPEEDPNPVTEVRTKGQGMITVERTHEFPVTASTIYVITDVEAEIAKIDAAIATWEAKRAPLQAILDEYEAA